MSVFQTISADKILYQDDYFFVVYDIDRFAEKIGRITTEEFDQILDNFLFLVGK